MQNIANKMTSESGTKQEHLCWCRTQRCSASLQQNDIPCASMPRTTQNQCISNRRLGKVIAVLFHPT